MTSGERILTPFYGQNTEYKQCEVHDVKNKDIIVSYWYNNKFVYNAKKIAISILLHVYIYHNVLTLSLNISYNS